MDARHTSLVLVVDDDVRAARVLARMLREDGFDVELAIDGAAAIGRLARAPIPDVLVTDLRMPHADGVAVARYARSRRHDIPVLVVTSYPELVSRHCDALVPAPTVLNKPVDYAVLNEVLRRVTGRLIAPDGTT